MKTLEEFLKEADIPDDLLCVLSGLKDVIKGISEKVNTADTGKAGSTNVFGEEQLAMDIQANELLLQEARNNKAVGLMASEEMEDEIDCGSGAYGICADPLDGSSLMDVNLAVGTIIGIYDLSERDDKTFMGVKGSDQVAALVAVYGPRTTILLTVRNGVKEFTLRSDGTFILTGENFKVGEGKMFAPGNLRACHESEDYLKLVNYWIFEKYTLRYSGGMVPDINQIILKGKGIFSYPGYSEAPEGKLRLLYECAPMAMLMEQAGGSASNGKKPILEIVAEKLDQRTPIFIGSAEEVKRCMEYL